MTLEQGKALFQNLSPTDKIKALLFFMHDLTNIARIISAECADDSQLRAALLYDISQRNHHLTSAALQILMQESTYPDDIIVEAMYRPGRADLAPHFLAAFEATMAFVSPAGN